MTTRMRPLALLTSLLVAAAAAGCVPAADLPEDCDASAVTRQATLSGEQLDPSTIEVCKDQQVTIAVTLERDAVLHLHGYDEEAPALEVTAGEVVDLEFTASRSGQFPIEIHTTDGPAEAEVGTFIVHER